MAKFLVFGATGNVGSALGRRLVAGGHDVHGVTRGGDGEGKLAAAGISPIVGDIVNMPSLADRLSGFDAAFLASADAPDQGRREIAAIDALVAQNTPHLVKLSAQSAGLTPPVSFGVQHHASENHLKASGVSYSILRPTFFQQSVLLMKDDIARKSAITAPMGKGKSAMVNVEDIAAVAARCLTDRGHSGKVYTLTGPEPVGFADICAALSELLGKKIKYVSPPAPIARLVMPFLTGMPRWQTSLIVDLMVAIRMGAQEAVTSDVETVTGKPPRSIQAFLTENKAEFTG
ncbi:NAD(P)H-binding protein [Hoeflea prorocentri]|uniref:NAD(P)H-binding protein n=1 Tax=Hoeflea prorocentri TaxID=1922333 RepID=A0A9X3ULJ7_9HYPH|nr:NAD(P)H-binding protein [Hoeflea prorocentri]MCY6382640.1 NAD(P)H-binding protein [Hoeflea prorocentri]MDA5400440.1 NAD(P)H-binding protein [Hoeflea prorocentri]